MRAAVAVLSLLTVCAGLAASPAWWLAPIAGGCAGLGWALFSDDGKADR